MIGGMARAARVFGRDDWLASARRALDFVRATLWKDERLLATYKDGKAHLNAYLDDHAFLLAALLEMLQADFRADDLEWAEAIGEALLERFHDRGGRRLLLHLPRPRAPHPPAQARPRQRDALGQRGGGLGAQPPGLPDGRDALPAGGRGHGRALLAALERSPAGFGSLLAALAETLVPPRTVIVNGPAGRLRPVARSPAARLPARDPRPVRPAGTRPACPRRSPSPPGRRSTPGYARALRACRPSSSPGDCANR